MSSVKTRKTPKKPMLDKDTGVPENAVTCVDNDENVHVNGRRTVDNTDVDCHSTAIDTNQLITKLDTLLAQVKDIGDAITDIKNNMVTKQDVDVFPKEHYRKDSEDSGNMDKTDNADDSRIISNYHTCSLRSFLAIAFALLALLVLTNSTIIAVNKLS